MGCIYNIPPLRSKDLPYLDVLSEAVNNLLRMLAGWFIAAIPAIPPVSLLLSYWMVGCYFMAIKRFAELRCMGNPVQAVAYRKSFGFYTEERLLVSIMFYGSIATLCFGAFIMRYRLELILAFPLVALVMAVQGLGRSETRSRKDSTQTRSTRGWSKVASIRRRLERPIPMSSTQSWSRRSGLRVAITDRAAVASGRE